jgi:regulator of sigma E protease
MRWRWTEPQCLQRPRPSTTSKWRARAFNRKSVWARIFIVLAGPIANLLLAVLVYWALFVVSMPGVKPVLGDPVPASAAAAAGFTNGDTVPGGMKACARLT